MTERAASCLLGAALLLCAERAAAQPAEPPADQEATQPEAAPAAEPPPSGAAPPPPPPGGDNGGVMVVGSRLSRLPGSVHVISSKQLERRELDDPHAVLLSVPGVSVRGEDGVGLRPNIGLRGVATDRSKKITLMEDGILLAPAPYSAPAAYYVPLVTRMSGMRVIKGPAAIAYGPQTVGGAIDFITREPPGSASGRVDVAGGEHRYRKVHAFYGTSDEKSAFLVEGVHLGSNGFKELDGNPSANTGFHRNEWMAKASFVPDPTSTERHELRLKLGFSDEQSNETYLGLTDADFETSPFRRYRASALDRMQWHRTQLVLSHEWGPAPEVTITSSVYRHDLERSWRKLNGFRGADLSDVLASPATPQNAVFYSVLTGASDTASDAELLLIGPNRRSFVSQGVQTLIRWKPPGRSLRHSVEYGLRYHHDSVDRHHSQDPFRMLAGQLESAGLPTEVTADNEASTHAVALHVADTMSLGPLTLTPGLRAELIRTESEDRLSGARAGSSYPVVLPGIGASWEFLPNTLLLGGVHRGFSPAPPGQPDSTEPELSVNYEAGVRHAGRRLRADLIGFYNDYSNLTDICTFSSGCLNQNLDRQFDAGTARVFGVEASFDHELGVRGELYVPLLAAYTYTYGEFLSYFDSEDPQFGRVSAGDPIPYLPEHQASATTGLGEKSWEATATGTYVGSMHEQGGAGGPLAGKKTDAYFTLDLAARYAVTSWLDVYGVAKNVLDQHYLASRRPFGARPGAPRSVQAGAKASF
ncbi:MAG: TonB-dependent receptor [Polyangiaceae bacterium]